MRKLILVSAIATLAFAQGKPAPSAPNPAATRDAGVPAAKINAGADGGVATLPLTPAAANLEVEKLRKEIAELKLRALEAEQRQQARADALGTQVEKMGKQLDDIKGQLTQVSEAEEKRVAAEDAAAARRSATASANSNLNAALTTMASGNTDGVEPTLRYAAGVFTGEARKNVQLAQYALSQGDVAQARQLLILALLAQDAQR